MTVLSSLAGVVGLLPAGFAPMMLASPDAGRNPATWALFLAVITFPLVCLAAVALSWVLYACGGVTPACWVSLLPFANVIVAGLAWLALGVFYKGMF
jgi:hypothetical protein